MSAIAGRVLLIPKGNYDATATYTMLDMVVYNGSSYICKQECTGVVPTNTTYWMLNASGSAVAYINDIGDVVITNPTNGQVLMYNSTTQKWVNGTLTLNGLNDTQFASLSDGQVLKYNATSQKWENADEAGGILPHLIVISETGSTVTATKGQTVITATETSTGHFECDVPEFGTWTIDAILSGDDAQVSLVVDTVKVYTVDDSHFHATVTVKYPTGATCRLQSTDETLYATGSPYTFTVHHAETYTITVTYNQRIYTDTVTFTTEGQSFSKTLPSPSEVDANDINWWLFFGGVSGTFSSLSEILANSTALSLLMASEDAVDYLVRCKEWINAGLVPAMTSATTPSGVVFASSYLQAHEPYKAFDKDETTSWYTSSNATNNYLGYQFAQPTKVSKIKISFERYGTFANKTFKLQGSNDGTNYTDIDTIVVTGHSGTTTDNITISKDFTSVEYKYYRLYTNDVLYVASTYVLDITELQFYPVTEGVNENQSAMSYIGLNNYCANTLLADSDWRDGICDSEYFESVLNVKVPTMTSDTTPSGVCFGSARYPDYGISYFGAFDNNDSSYVMLYNQVNTFLGYEFQTPCRIVKMVSNNITYSGNQHVLEGSDDNSTYTPLGTISGAGITEFIIDNKDIYKYYRLRHTVADGGTTGFQYFNLQLYGREDV